MREEYVIEAWSPTLGQTLREFNLGDGQRSIVDLTLAERTAESFAQRLNNQRWLNQQDWQARVTWQQLGIETFIAQQNSQQR